VRGCEAQKEQEIGIMRRKGGNNYTKQQRMPTHSPGVRMINV
jgi:hypothetical protein